MYIGGWLELLFAFVLGRGDWVVRGEVVEGKRHSCILDVGFLCRGLGRGGRDEARGVGGCLRVVGV